MRATLLFTAAVGCLLAGCGTAPGSQWAEAVAPTATVKPPASVAASPTPAASPTRTPSSSRAATIKFGYPTKADADGEIKKAMAAAKADGKNVLLNFGANWCGVCASMGRTFPKPAVQSAFASYHVVHINVDTSIRTLSKYDSSGSFALPVLIVVSPSGEVLVNTAKAGRPAFTEAGFSAFLREWAV